MPAKRTVKTKITTMRLSTDLLEAADREVAKRGMISRTQFFEQTLRRALGMPTSWEVEQGNFDGNKDVNQ